MKTTELKLYVDMIKDSMRLEMGVMVIRNMQEWLNIGDQALKTFTGNYYKLLLFLKLKLYYLFFIYFIFYLSKLIINNKIIRIQ